MLLQFRGERDKGQFDISNVVYTSALIVDDDTDLYKVVWVRSGKVELVVDSAPCELNAGQVAFFTPHNIIKKVGQTGELVAYSFNREFYCIRDHDHEVACNGHLFYGSSSIPVITLSEKGSSAFQTLTETFQEEFKTKESSHGEMLRALLKQLLIRSSRSGRELFVNSDLERSKLDIVRRYNVLVEQNFRKLHKVQDYASLLARSPKTVSNLFAQFNNKTPLQIINERVVLEAKRLLTYTVRGIDEIALELGYDEASHFSKFFKKQTGMSPSGFRSRVK